MLDSEWSLLLVVSRNSLLTWEPAFIILCYWSSLASFWPSLVLLYDVLLYCLTPLCLSFPHLYFPMTSHYTTKPSPYCLIHVFLTEGSWRGSARAFCIFLRYQIFWVLPSINSSISKILGSVLSKTIQAVIYCTVLVYICITLAKADRIVYLLVISSCMKVMLHCSHGLGCT